MKTLSKTLQVVIGLALFVSLFSYHATGGDSAQLLIWKLLTPEVLKVIAWIVLFFLSLRLMYGKLIHDGEQKSLLLKLMHKIAGSFSKKQAE